MSEILDNNNVMTTNKENEVNKISFVFDNEKNKKDNNENALFKILARFGFTLGKYRRK